MTKHRLEHSEIQKARTGIPGLDDITKGGLPQGRPTLVSGGPGSGKTLFGVSFLVNGAQQFAEPGVLMTFEENAAELAQDVRSLGYDLDTLVAQKKLIVDYIHVDRSEIEETGEYDLEGLFVRLEHAIKQIGAKRVMLDTIETLFGGLKDTGILRAELRRLFRWMRDRGITAVVTAERGEQMFTRQGLEEYITDAVISLDHRVHEQISTRRIRVVKYRGSTHGTNEYPFLIDRDGITVLPVTSLLLEHEAPNERISSGLTSLDDMLGGKGYFRASTVLLSGTAGTGKTTLAAQFIEAACARGERCMYFLFEESPSQLIRNMRSAGIDLQRWVDKGLLEFHADRPNRHGLETHLLEMHHAVGGVRSRRGRARPDHQSHGRGHAIRRSRHAHARHRLLQDTRRHRRVHQPHLFDAKPRGHRVDDLLAHGHLDPGGRGRGRRASATDGSTYSSPAACRTLTMCAHSTSPTTASSSRRSARVPQR